MPPDRITARQLWVVIESVHAVTYFAPRCLHALREAGLKGFWSGYFAARAAPLGHVGSGPVVAAFFNFHPTMVQRAVPSCWEVVDPARLTVERAAAASAALRELCPAEVLADVVGALPALRTASARGTGGGRVMAGANASLWTALEPALHGRGLPAGQMAMAETWQACTTLREHRGDGHVAALLTHGLAGLDAHLLAAGTEGVATEVLRDNRGWSEAEWEEARHRLAASGLLDTHGTATGSGHALRRSVEAMTDDLAEVAFATLSDAEVSHLYGALLPCARQVQSAGLIPFPNPMGLPGL